MSKIPGLTGIRINADDDNEHVIISLTESDEPKDKSEEPEFLLHLRYIRNNTWD